MTTLRTLVFLGFASLFVLAAHAAPPANLTGQYVSLNGERLEFPEAASGAAGSETVTYTYAVQDELSSSLIVTYPANGRSRNVSLSFLADGTPLRFVEIEFSPAFPPTPPVVRSGEFEIGLLEVTPPLESSAPDLLTGSFIMTGGKRYEFLTAENGRVYAPGKSDFFTYEYAIIDEVSAGVAIVFDEGTRRADLILTFNAEGKARTCEATEFLNEVKVSETSGPFEAGLNRHLGDLKIGTDALSLQGNDHFNAYGLRQTTGRLSDSMDMIVYPFELENDGDLDRFRLDASWARHTFKAEYFSRPGRENITAMVTTGRYRTPDLAHREVAAYTMELTPLRETGAFVGAITVRSESVESAKDTALSITFVKAKKKQSSHKGKSRDKGKTRG